MGCFGVLLGTKECLIAMTTSIPYSLKIYTLFLSNDAKTLNYTPLSRVSITQYAEN
jgi:hypothetical protein